MTSLRWLVSCAVVRLTWSSILALTIFVSLAGCGGETDPTLPVWGKVTLNGVPVKHGDIEFGSSSPGGIRRGALIIDGNYKTAPMQGLVPGEYIVRIFSVPVGDTPSGDAPMPGEEKVTRKADQDLIPAKYNMRSQEKVTVSADKDNEFNFDIKTK